MVDETSSADPDALEAYAEVGLRIDAQMEASAMRLAAVLDHFAATCTEYKLGIDGRMADPLRALAQRNREHNLWVRSVAQEFRAADSDTPVDGLYFGAMDQVTPTPEPASTPQPSPAPVPVGTPTVPPAEPPQDVQVPGDYVISRLIDGAVEWIKAHIEPQYAERLVVQITDLIEREGTYILSHNGQVVAYTLRESTSDILTVTARQELLNGAAVGFKEFLESATTGVPLVSGAVQGVSDWVTEPDLTTPQRVGRIVVAGGGAALISAGVVLILPEETAAGAVVAATLAFNGIFDLEKPWLFGWVGLTAHKEGEQSSESPSVPPAAVPSPAAEAGAP